MIRQASSGGTIAPINAVIRLTVTPASARRYVSDSSFMISPFVFIVQLIQNCQNLVPVVGVFVVGHVALQLPNLDNRRQPRSQPKRHVQVENIAAFIVDFTSSDFGIISPSRIVLQCSQRHRMPL
jgi:hypothetical protein